jgi:hypothetical protein
MITQCIVERQLDILRGRRALHALKLQVDDATDLLLAERMGPQFVVVPCRMSCRDRGLEMKSARQSSERCVRPTVGQASILGSAGRRIDKHVAF